ncbi:8962_t:CDS:2, partial [Funneliformis caledonium]
MVKIVDFAQKNLRLTIHRNLKKIELKAYIPHHKPAMIELHYQAHFEWTLEHKNWM